MTELSQDKVLFGRWRLEARLGTGLSGETWRAVDLENDTRVAIKTGPRSLFHEAELLTSLDHPHILSCLGVMYEAGAGHPVLITPHVEGGDLAQHIGRRGPFGTVPAARLGLQLVDALETLHALGVLHRDLKPNNVLVTELPDSLPLLQVCDFGISRRLKDGAVRVTEVVVTRGYSPPEQITDKALTEAADIHALGGCLRFLATGRHPDQELLSTDHALEPLWSKMLAELPGARPALWQVRAALEGFSEGRVTLVPDASSPPNRRTSRSRGGWLIALCLVAVAGAAVHTWWPTPSGQPPPLPTGPADPSAEAEVWNLLEADLTSPELPHSEPAPTLTPSPAVIPESNPVRDPEPRTEPAVAKEPVPPIEPVAIQVYSYPQARIVVDGRYVRDTELGGATISLQGGSHVVRLETAEAHHSWTVEVTPSGGPDRLCYRFAEDQEC